MKISSAFPYIAIILFVFSIPSSLSAQVLQKGFSAGLYIGLSKAFTDVYEPDINPSIGAGIQYNVTPFTFLNVEYSTGLLSREEPDRYGKAFINHTNRLTATANISLGEILKPDSRKANKLIYNIYAGAGAGLTRSNISEPNALTSQGWGGITYKGTDLSWPINVGVNFSAGRNRDAPGPLSFNLNLQHNLTSTEMLDGYDPENSGDRTNDSFAELSLGIRYSFGKKESCFF